MKSSKTSSWKSTPRQKLSKGIKTYQEVLITNSTRDLVEFYWSKQKRFSGSYKGFPLDKNLKV
tara:strand:+ start:972 stop:1160 length:189 start_codon:yes stop_codon:yes gene_type:complete